MDRWSLLQSMMANKPGTRKGPELSQGVDVPLEDRQYDAPREIAGAPKPVEAVVPRILTDSVTGLPGTLASVGRMMYDYYPEKFTKTTKTKTEEASLPEWFLTALTDPNFRNTEQGKKAIEYAQKRIGSKEKLSRNLALREERELMDNTSKYITPNEKLPNELPLADADFKLVKNPDSNAFDQAWSLENPYTKVKDWINIQKDYEGVPSVGFLKELPAELKGNALAAQAYTQLAKQYGTLRSDPTGSTSSAIKRSFWDQFGQPFDHEFGGMFGKETRYEVPFKHNLHELNTPIRSKYKALGNKAEEEIDLLRHTIRPDQPTKSSMSDTEFWNLGKEINSNESQMREIKDYLEAARRRRGRVSSIEESFPGHMEPGELAEMGPNAKRTSGHIDAETAAYQKSVLADMAEEYKRGRAMVEALPEGIRGAIYDDFDQLRQLEMFQDVPYDELMKRAIKNITGK